MTPGRRAYIKRGKLRRCREMESGSRNARSIRRFLERVTRDYLRRAHKLPNRAEIKVLLRESIEVFEVLIPYRGIKLDYEKGAATINTKVLTKNGVAVKAGDLMEGQEYAFDWETGEMKPIGGQDVE